MSLSFSLYDNDRVRKSSLVLFVFLTSCSRHTVSREETTQLGGWVPGTGSFMLNRMDFYEFKTCPSSCAVTPDLAPVGWKLGNHPVTGKAILLRHLRECASSNYEYNVADIKCIPKPGVFSCKFEEYPVSSGEYLSVPGENLPFVTDNPTPDFRGHCENNVGPVSFHCRLVNLSKSGLVIFDKDDQTSCFSSEGATDGYRYMNFNSLTASSLFDMEGDVFRLDLVATNSKNSSTSTILFRYAPDSNWEFASNESYENEIYETAKCKNQAPLYCFPMTNNGWESAYGATSGPAVTINRTEHNRLDKQYRRTLACDSGYSMSSTTSQCESISESCTKVPCTFVQNEIKP